MAPGVGEIEAVRALQDAGYTVVRQLAIRGYFVDIAIPELGVVIEVDSPSKKMKRAQKRRQRVIEADGWKVLRCLSTQPEQAVELVRAARVEPKEAQAKAVGPSVIVRKKLGDT